MKPLTLLALALAVSTAGCKDSFSYTQGLDREARAAIMTQGLTSVALQGPSFNCARHGPPRMIGGATDGWKAARKGVFFTARSGANRGHAGRPVRGMVCVGRTAEPSILIFS